ncbi:MAG: 50S ribosomal protein L3 [Candidatus Babeliales bacterium]
MLKGIWGKKIGMTQVFAQDSTIVPVTVIDCNHWFVTNLCVQAKHGYDAVQVGYLRKRYREQPFSSEWLKNPKKYFQALREIKLDSHAQAAYEIGQPLQVASVIEAGQKVDLVGITKGHGFQGVVKRHGFAGGRASHGPRFGRWPGSMGFMRSQGKVIKGKRLPGHMGGAQRVMKKLEVIRIERDSNIALVKGSVAGSAGSLVFMEKP